LKIGRHLGLNLNIKLDGPFETAVIEFLIIVPAWASQQADARRKIVSYSNTATTDGIFS
jgi:hypothetical protein